MPAEGTGEEQGGSGPGAGGRSGAEPGVQLGRAGGLRGGRSGGLGGHGLGAERVMPGSGGESGVRSLGAVHRDRKRLCVCMSIYPCVRLVYATKRQSQSRRRTYVNTRSATRTHVCTKTADKSLSMCARICRVVLRK